jgi:hypothetical protein
VDGLSGNDRSLARQVAEAIRRPGRQAGTTLRLTVGSLVGVPVKVQRTEPGWVRMTLLETADPDLLSLRERAEADLVAAGWRAAPVPTLPHPVLAVEVFVKDADAAGELVVNSLHVLDAVVGRGSAPPEDRLARRLETLLRTAFLDGAPSSLDVPGGGYLQWIGIPQGGLHVEAGDGEEFDQPLRSDLRDRLVRCGWGTPDDEVRNCWFQVHDLDGISDAVQLLLLALTDGFEVSPADVLALNS